MGRILLLTWILWLGRSSRLWSLGPGLGLRCGGREMFSVRDVASSRSRMRLARVEPEVRADPAAFVSVRWDRALLVRVRAAAALREVMRVALPLR